MGRDFNEMVNTFEKAQRELQLYHQKELKISENLATIGEMSSRIAHEIRNPVTGISRAVDIIMADSRDPENMPILEEIQRQANRVNQAINNLLRFSKSKEINPETADINLVLRSVVFFLQSQAFDRVIQFDLNLEPNLPLLSFDREMIENVLLNLSFNSIDALQGDGTITFASHLDHPRRSVLITVTDTGTGIAAETGKEIFKPFFTTRTKGTGLGLAISKEMVEKHHGDLWYENNAGPGCTFFIRLPLIPVPSGIQNQLT